MKSSLATKLILTYLAVALVTVSVVLAVISFTSDESLRNMVVDQQIAQVSQEAQRYYASIGSLDGFFFYYMNYSLLNQWAASEGPAPLTLRRDDLRGLAGLIDANYIAVFPMKDYQIGEKVPTELVQNAEPINLDGVTIAYVIRDAQPEFELSPEEQRYVQRTNLAIGAAAGAGVLTAVILGVMLAGSLLKPIRTLTSASQELAQGGFGKQVPVKSKDELGQLTRTFNQMSADLDHADQERRRLTADITHDLSTPLQIISGYLEMFEEGDVAISPERLEIIKGEVEHLRHLVGDLTTLSQAEAGGLEMNILPVDPNELLRQVYQTYEPIAHRQGIRLLLDQNVLDRKVLVDEWRMLQVLKNLLDNALRYTPEGGTIWLESRLEAEGKVSLIVRDSGQGIAQEDLPYVFDRFYQTDKARTGSKGKMGLGLAICKAFTQAMNCSIRAESAGSGQGTSMIITMDAFTG